MFLLIPGLCPFDDIIIAIIFPALLLWLKRRFKWCRKSCKCDCHNKNDKGAWLLLIIWYIYWVMINLRYTVIYPQVNYSNPGNDPEITRYGRGHCLVGMITLNSDSIPREEVCDILFAGFGNHPGNEQAGYRFTTGNRFMDTAHLRWATAKVRSMSIGDVVHFENSNLYYICDSCGWMVVNKEHADSWLAFERKHGCDSFDLKQWKKSAGIEHNTLS